MDACFCNYFDNVTLVNMNGFTHNHENMLQQKEGLA